MIKNMHVSLIKKANSIFCTIHTAISVHSMAGQNAISLVNVTNQIFIMKHRPAAPGWRVSRTSVAMCIYLARGGHNFCNSHAWTFAECYVNL